MINTLTTISKKQLKLNISGKKLTFFILFFTIIMETLISEFHFPSFIRYINDAALIILFFFMGFKFISVLKKTGNIIILYSITLFLIASLISAFVNFVSVQLVLWALRNNFRGIVFFLAIIVYFNEIDLDKIFNILFILQIINCILALYQFFILNHEMDDIGGIFGYGNGAGVNIFNVLLFSYFLNAYLMKKEKLWKLLTVIVTAFVIAAIAEEKATYIFFVVIMVVSILLNHFTIRKMIAVIICLIGLFFGLQLLKIYYPGMYERLIDVELLLDYAGTTHETGYRIPRIGAFDFISNKFFSNSLNYLFGLGFGNCENSNFSFFQSEFYQQFGDYNYRWFTHQWIFIEGGYIGFISFLLIFISVLFCLWKKLKSVSQNKSKIYLIAGICNTMSLIVFIWYNATLKVDITYLAYFSLAIGLIATKNQHSNNRKLISLSSMRDI